MHIQRRGWHGRTFTASACTLVAILAGAVGAQASPVPGPLPAIKAALGAATSYQVVEQETGSQTPPAIAKIMTTVVRTAAGVSIDRIEGMRPSGAGDTTIVEDIVMGNRVCVRVAFSAPLPLTGRLTCHTSARDAAAFRAEPDPSQSFVYNTVYTFAAHGTDTIAGTACDVYNMTTRSKTSHATGTLSVMHATGLPCSYTAVTVGPAIGPTTATATDTVRSTTTWTRFNDRSLTIPAITVQ